MKRVLSFFCIPWVACLMAIRVACGVPRLSSDSISKFSFSPLKTRGHKLLLAMKLKLRSGVLQYAKCVRVGSPYSSYVEAPCSFVVLQAELLRYAIPTS